MLHYLLFMVPGEDGNGTVKKGSRELAECLIDETE